MRNVFLFGALMAVTPGLALAVNVDKPTYSKDIAPILDANCVHCHRPGDVAPMALRTYDEVRPWVKSMAQKVGEKQMPPWHADPGYGPWSNDRSLSGEQIATITRWIETGAPQGNPADRPASQVALERGEWALGTPDYVFEFDPYDMAADGPDQFRNPIHQTNFGEDKWITAVEIAPKEKSVVHHVILWLKEDAESSQQGWLSAWAGGTGPDELPKGTGRLLTKGSAIMGDMHYHATGKGATDVTRVGLYFGKTEDVQKELVNLWVMNAEFQIPAGDPNYEARSTYTFAQDAHVLGLAPHMHYRGKDFAYTATFPDGTSKELLKVSKYDFNWQTNYEFKDALAVPKGTRIDCVAHWDNSANNPANPDPTKDVTFGPQSYDEMMIGFVDYVVDEGVRPKPTNSQIEQKINELAQKYPGQVFRVDIPGQGASGVHVPKEGEGGWWVSFNGVVASARLYDIKWDGDAFKCEMAIPGQALQHLEGKVDRAAGVFSFTITLDEGQKFPGQGTIL